MVNTVDPKYKRYEIKLRFRDLWLLNYPHRDNMLITVVHARLRLYTLITLVHAAAYVRKRGA